MWFLRALIGVLYILFFVKYQLTIKTINTLKTISGIVPWKAVADLRILKSTLVAFGHILLPPPQDFQDLALKGHLPEVR